MINSKSISGKQGCNSFVLSRVKYLRVLWEQCKHPLSLQESRVNEQDFCTVTTFAFSEETQVKRNFFDFKVNAPLSSTLFLQMSQTCDLVQPAVVWGYLLFLNMLHVILHSYLFSTHLVSWCMSLLSVRTASHKTKFLNVLTGMWIYSSSIFFSAIVFVCQPEEHLFYYLNI